MISRRTWRAASVAALLLAWTTSWGCAQTDARLGDESPDAGPPSDIFTPPPGEDGGADAVTPPDNVLMCVATECPAPFTTCAADVGPAYKCGTDLSRDPNNCGSCGNKCLVYAPIALSSRCVDGTCELECMNKAGALTSFHDCNGTIDDGCETDTNKDPNNCGVCGHACAAGQSCFEGKCGCTAPLIECPTDDGPKCINPKTDDANCGGCGTLCDAFPTGDGLCSPPPPNAYYGCKAGTCGHMKCGGTSADCNNDIGTAGCASDGCEVVDIKTDHDNCGGCGIKCTGDEQCVDEGFGYECAVPCTRFGKTQCPFGCADLLTDTLNCGGCENNCPAAAANQIASCDKGLCSYACAPGFADCNENAADGCEVNLNTHAGNCGACGNSCDVGAGQPCIEGKCLTVPCDAGVTK